jgi:hypothetical protein
VNNKYTWSDGDPWDFDGTAKTDFIDRLNTEPCFAGHCDWRLPKVSEDADAGNPELETILLAFCLGGDVPCIDPIFGPTAASFYWSATTDAANPNRAWAVHFLDGFTFTDPKYPHQACPRSAHWPVNGHLVI